LSSRATAAISGATDLYVPDLGQGINRRYLQDQILGLKRPDKWFNSPLRSEFS